MRAFDSVNVVMVRSHVLGPPPEDELEHGDHLHVLLAGPRPEHQETLGVEGGGVGIVGKTLKQLPHGDGVAKAVEPLTGCAVAFGKGLGVAVLFRPASERTRVLRGAAGGEPLVGCRLHVQVRAEGERDPDVGHGRLGIEARGGEKRPPGAVAMEAIIEGETLIEEPLCLGARGANPVVGRAGARGEGGSELLPGGARQEKEGAKTRSESPLAPDAARRT
jgi:hypothetical protein